MLNLNNICLAYSFETLREKIHTKSIHNIDYNFSKSAAIVIQNGSAIYINFKTKQTKTIIKDWPNVFSKWKSDNIVQLKGSCGTGCSQSIIFLAPTTSIVCPIHEFRLESLNLNEPPDFYNNDPLLIDAHKKIYVCYAEDNVIQVFRMPRKLQKIIHPPNGYYADKASIRHHHLLITYRNAHDAVALISYPSKLW